MGPLAVLTTPAGRVAVHRARAVDVPAIVDLLRDDPIARDRERGAAAAYETAFAAIEADPNQLLVVVRDERDAAVATLQLTFVPGLSRGGALRAQLEAVRVAPALRGAGLGSAVLDWALGESRRRGARLVQLTTDKRRADARRFYSRAGFVASHEGMKLDLGAGSSGSGEAGNARP